MPAPRTGDGGPCVPAASIASRTTHGQGMPIPRSHTLPCPAGPARAPAGAHPRSEVSGVDPGGTLLAGRLAAITHGAGRPRVSCPHATAAGSSPGVVPGSGASGRMAGPAPRHAPEEQGPWPCRRCRKVGRHPAVLPPRAGGAALPGAVEPPAAAQSPQSCWDRAAAARCINDLMQKKPGVGLIARKTAELQSSRNKSGWKWSGSEDGAAGAAQPERRSPERKPRGEGGRGCAGPGSQRTRCWAEQLGGQRPLWHREAQAARPGSRPRAGGEGLPATHPSPPAWPRSQGNGTAGQAACRGRVTDPLRTLGPAREPSPPLASSVEPGSARGHQGSTRATHGPGCSHPRTAAAPGQTPGPLAAARSFEDRLPPAS